MGFQLRHHGLFRGKVLYQEVDNPGENDCGFYSFAIGLIDIIQREIAKGNLNPEQLQILNAVTTLGVQYNQDEFIRFGYNTKARRGTDHQLLTKLMRDLRHILHNQHKQEIYQGSIYIEGRAEKLDASVPYNQFTEIFDHYRYGKKIDRDCNLLFQSGPVRQYAHRLARDPFFLGIRNPKRMASEIEHAFLWDLFGQNYLQEAMVPWDETLTVRDDLHLAEADRKVLAEFKQFQLAVQDCYFRFQSYRRFEPNFKYLPAASIFAKELREKKKRIKHRQVKIVTGDNILSQDSLEAGTLYYQIVNTENNLVQVYSRDFKQSYQLAQAKVPGLIKELTKLAKRLPQDNEVFTINEKASQFNQLINRADDTINDQAIFKEIPVRYLELYIQSTFGAQKTINDLDETQLARLREVIELLDAEMTEELSHATKEAMRANKSIQLQGKIQDRSSIAQALAYVVDDGKWLATDQDLNCFAELFKVHLSILENGRNTARSQGTNDSNRPRVTINNLGNYHWTTRLSVGYQTGTDCLKYADWSYKKALLTKEEVKDLLLSYTTGFMATFFGRTYMQKANELITLCEDPNSTIVDIMTRFRHYMSEQEYKPGCSFLKRFEYLDARYRSSFEDDLFNKRDIERIFANYIHTGYFRNHLDEAQRIVDDCKDPQKNISDICGSIEKYVKETTFNSDSSFMQCVKEVRALKRFADENKVDEEHSSPLHSIF